MGLNINDYVYLVTGLFGAYITYRYMMVFFDHRRTSSKVELISYMLYFILITIIYFNFNIPVLNLVSNILLYFILSYNYRASLRKRIISTILIYMIFAAVETVFVLLSGYIYPSVFTRNPYYSSIWGMFAIKIISFIVVLLLGNFKNMRKGVDIPYIYWVSIFLMPLGSMFILLILLQNYSLHKLSIIGSITVLFSINISAFYLYDSLNKLFQDEIEKIALEEQNKYYQVQIETINKSNKNVRKLRHDISDHLAALKSYIDKGEIERASAYISEIKDITANKKELSNTGNMDIDSILNYKLQEAQSKGILVSLESKVPSDLNVPPLDIVVILGNLLDNAIEASSKVENDKRIDIKIIYKKNSLFIFIRNTFNNSIKYERGRIKSSKKNSENHGIGLNNVEEILRKHNGTMKITHDKNNFNAKIIMYLK